MAKRHPTFVCQSCGAVYPRWKGKCEACGGWNSIVEETGSASPMAGPVATRPSRAKGRVFPLEGLRGEATAPPRTPSGIAELDRVTGGGFVRGSVILLGGDPGIGKSTLLMQASAALAMKGARVAYISGEEAVAQVRLRAERLGLSQAPVELASETNVEDIIATLTQGQPPALAIIDSIQTMWTETVESAPGTVTQVRGSAQALIRFAKTSGTAVILVGHVTKDGQIAGPRVVEHMVDAVAQFEGDQGHHSSLGTPRRAVVGWDPSRLSMVLAVLEAHGGLRLGMHDVYLNVAGGLRITEPAADLAAAAALASSLSGSALPPDTVYFGEIGLSGAIRPVAQAPARLKEAAKLGFAQAVTPVPRAEKGERLPLATSGVGHITDLVAGIASGRPRARREVEAGARRRVAAEEP
jgi:predicted ATP-dependent serine protease